MIDDTGRNAMGRDAAERLAFFSDAVVAIAITLLAIDLPVPTGDSTPEFLAALRADPFDYLAFLISFVVIGSHWRSHHRVFGFVERIDRRLVTLNLSWLLLIVLNPFLTKVIGEGRLTAVRFGIYAFAQALLLALFGLMIARLARRAMFVEGTPASLTRHGWLESLSAAAGFLVSIPLFPLMHGWAFALWAVVPFALGQLRALGRNSSPDRAHGG
ncbi:TMEM175 family protein [Pseudonocardia hispaniensis]|uniref:TMEM175 family protein n=1 Tax=Pseudonocardia hispaniensis TaxID=904933 RepID=A0ABW1IXE9_9PSEU